MTFRVQFTPESDSDLDRLDSTATNRVLSKIRWLALNFEGIKRKGLTGDLGAFSGSELEIIASSIPMTRSLK